ncbi:MAG: hypothetical protein A2664_02305 [Candidatus Taylorbacteria bacterium RIFCSPHIGHO2_01_FULL_46_22b]|uniref:Peptidase M14 domain-containing protein n=1 Tax=Candidatus Taylorbacteria bacterium RIFCSPHIGHO2_01_FULL_46_22b TaxID=1802301 RepID=A0A1G2M5C8_9BACT|nr:MAG: hypothetical protein A2664_02305 [Candidatus Taylorbacteria bacterium RIFCSPHIGHO2_01_FULL_46_22b]
MQTVSTKKVVAIVVLIIALGVAGFWLLSRSKHTPEAVKVETPRHTVIGRSVENRAIDAYTYGNGGAQILFVGGVHGGYEWNSVLLAYKFMDYLDVYPEIVPQNLTVIVIPSLNPDGVYKIVGKEGRFALADIPVDTDQSAGRFNAHEVDLNRNFDCKWQSKSTWRDKVVSAGSAPFSEPEAEALKDFVLANHPSAVIFWHSQSNAVYASQCENGILPITLDIMNAYAKAAGYPAVKTFDAYATTGAADDWLASINIPAITVELKTHEDIEWEKNLKGIQALFEYLEEHANILP